MQKINQVSLKDVENTDLYHTINELTSFNETFEKHDLINKNKNLEEIQNKTIFTDVDNNLTSVSVGHDIGVLDESYIKKVTEIDSSLIKSQLLINSETESIKLTEKTEIRPKKYDIVTTVKNKLHISDEKVCIDLYDKYFHKIYIILKF